MSRKQILLNAFNMNCVGHINHGLWTHPRDRSTEFNSLEYWTELARLLERGLFDGLFIAGDDRDVVRKSHRFLQISGRQIQEWRAGSVPLRWYAPTA